MVENIPKASRSFEFHSFIPDLLGVRIFYLKSTVYQKTAQLKRTIDS